MRIVLGRRTISTTQGLRIRRRMLKATIVAVSMGAVLTHLGCATSSGRPPYPTEWASIKSVPTDDGCPNLEGTYSNQGSAAFPLEAGAPPSLAEVFTSLARGQGPTSPAAWKQSWPIIPRGASEVTIDQTPETMTVTFTETAGRRTALNFRRYRFRLFEQRVDDLFHCSTSYGEPHLRFLAEPQSHTSVPVVGIGGGGIFVVVLRAVDGSLVVNWRSDSIALTPFLLGSGYAVNNLWYRYPLLAPDKLN